LVVALDRADMSMAAIRRVRFRRVSEGAQELLFNSAPDLPNFACHHQQLLDIFVSNENPTVLIPTEWSMTLLL
jgi:hypothetical protein